MKRLLLFAVLGLMIFVGCRKDENVDLDHKDSHTLLTSAEHGYINDLESINPIVDGEEKSALNGDNPNNYMDTFGMYYKDMFNSVNIDEGNNPSKSETDYRSKYTSYMDNNPMGEIIIKNHPSALFRKVYEISMIAIMDSNIRRALAKTIAIETYIARNGIIKDNDQERAILAFISALKHSRVAVHNSGGVNFCGGVYGFGRVGFWDCFDRAFESRAESNLSILNPENIANGSPCQCILAWCGLPATLGGSIGDAIIGGISDCI
mgnify:CR=1 FL=1|tara:strand:+ start:486 stop:1277 length:792 start_codon:yes stop_codon:yes gene_type:complete